MGRKPRVEYAGALYHVMCRGNRQQQIFQDDQDRKLFLKTLSEVCARTGWKVCAYVLMPNHYHMVIETPEANLISGMKWFQGTYTKRHNSRHKEWGHLFQGRYKSVVIDPGDPAYFQTACNYVHLNPVRAGLVKTNTPGALGKFVWSSSSYLSNPPEKDPSWLRIGRVVEACMGSSVSQECRMAYLHHLETQAASELDNGEYKMLRRGWCLGSTKFKSDLCVGLNEQLNSLNRDSIVGETRRMHDQYEAERILLAGVGIVELDLSEKESLRRNDMRKELMAWILTKKTSVGQEWITQQLGMGNRVNVSRAIHHIETSTNKVMKENKVKLEEMCRPLH